MVGTALVSGRGGLGVGQLAGVLSPVNHHGPIRPGEVRTESAKGEDDKTNMRRKIKKLRNRTKEKEEEQLQTENNKNKKNIQRRRRRNMDSEGG